MFCRILFLLIISGFAQAQSSLQEVAGVLNTIHPDSIKKHITYLADDKLRGRQPGTPEYQMAIDYVINKYKQLGLAPAGENGTYLQPVKLRKAFLDAADVQFSLSGASKPTVFGEDFVLFPHFEEQDVEITAPLIFAGYGISAPEFGYDDYKGIDVKGKIVVIVSGAPDHFASTIRSHSLGRPTVVQTAIEKGAIGVIYRNASGVNLKGAAYFVSNSGLATALSSEQKMFYPSYSGGAGMGLKVYAAIGNDLFNSISKKTEDEMTAILNDLKAGKPGSFDMQTTASVKYKSKHKDIASANVVGVLEGSDKKLKKEYVVHTAHLDHVGVGTAVKGDSIYNGAHDNASGVACSIEVARLYSNLKQKPKRSIVFVMVTAEEMGLLGSSYFATFPSVPKKNIVANVNMDMPTIIAPLLAVVPLGAPHSSLINQVKSAADYLGLDVENDPEPEQNRFIRSDQYSFVRQGIPALHIKYGDKMAEPGKKLSDEVKKWRAETYHQPQDQIDTGIFDFEAGKKYVQLNFIIGYQVAQNKERPTWNKGDFFGDRFAKASK